MPPHPAKVAQKKAPHPATVAQAKLPPHPATVQRATTERPVPGARPPHPATLSIQQRHAMDAARPPHPATVAQRRPASAPARGTTPRATPGVAQPLVPLLVVGALAGIAYLGYKIVNHVRVQRLLDAIVGGQTNLRIDTSLLGGNGLTDQEIQTEVTRLLTDLGWIAATSSGWNLLNAIAYPDQTHAGNRVELTLWDQPNHNAEMAPNFPLGLSDNAKTQRITTGVGVNCFFVVKAGEAKDLANANHVTNPFLPTPSDIVLYHELVHGYHFQNGTVDRTVINNQMAQAGVDVGLSASEYQATGLNAQGHQDFTGDPYTENRYRRELRALGRSDAAHRTHYRPV